MPAGLRDGSIIEREPVRFDRRAAAAIGRYVKPGEVRTVRIRARNLIAERILYASDGLRVRGYVVRPKHRGPHPIILFNRGGTGSFGMINQEILWRRMGLIAQWGYVVAGSQYRGNEGSEGREDWGGADVNDVLNLMLALKHTPGADSERVGMVGWSRGGVETYRALAKMPSVRAAVVGAAPSDLFALCEERPDLCRVLKRLIPARGQGWNKELRRRSVIFWVNHLPRCPLLLMHGTADERVPATHSTRLAEQLLKTRHPFRLVLFDNGKHDLSEHDVEVTALMQSWLERYMHRNRS